MSIPEQIMHTSDIEGADKYRLSGHKGPKAVCIQKGVCFQKVETSPGTEVSEKNNVCSGNKYRNNARLVRYFFQFCE